MTRRARPEWYRKMLYQVKRRQDPCHYCGKPATSLDHVIELQEGGRDHPSNLVPACTRCNSSKGRQTQLRMLGRRPAPYPKRRPPVAKRWTRK